MSRSPVSSLACAAALLLSACGSDPAIEGANEATLLNFDTPPDEVGSPDGDPAADGADNSTNANSSEDAATGNAL